MPLFTIFTNLTALTWGCSTLFEPSNKKSVPRQWHTNHTGLKQLLPGSKIIKWMKKVCPHLSGGEDLLSKLTEETSSTFSWLWTMHQKQRRLHHMLRAEIQYRIGRVQHLLKAHSTYCRGCGHSNSAAISQQLNWWVKCYQNRYKWWPIRPNNATKWSDWLLLGGRAALHHNPAFSDICSTSLWCGF